MRSRNTQNPSSVKEFVETRGQTSPAHVRPPAYHCRVTALDRCHTWIGLRPKQHKGGECSKQFPPTILAGKHRSLNCIDTYRCHVNICLDWDLELFSQIRSTTHVMEITIEPKRPLEPKLYWWFASPTFDGSNPPQNMGSRTATVQSSCIIEGFQGLMFNLGNVWSNVPLLGKVNKHEKRNTNCFIHLYSTYHPPNPFEALQYHQTSPWGIHAIATALHAAETAALDGSNHLKLSGQTWISTSTGLLV